MKHSWLYMVRFPGLGAFGLRRFRPSAHLYPPLVLVSCLIASTAAPAESTLGHEALAELRELRELLVPGFGREPEIRIGLGGIGLSNPVTGLVVPPFLPGSPSGSGSIIDGFVVPTGFFLARSGDGPGRGSFRLTNPLAFRWAGTATTAPLQLTWQAGTLFDNVFDGSTGAFVPFRIVPAGSPSFEPVLALVAEPADRTDDPGVGDDVFETALLPPARESPAGGQPGGGPGGRPGGGPGELPGDGGDGPSGQPGGEGEAADPASVPGPLPVAGVALAWRCSRRLRQRLRQGR